MNNRPTLAELAAQTAAAEAGGTGWKCPNCSGTETRVRKTWDAAAGRRRSRVCAKCGKGVKLTTEVEVPKGFKVLVVPDDDEQDEDESERACA